MTDQMATAAFSLHWPGRIVFSAGQINCLGAEAQALGNHTFLATTPQLSDVAFTARAQADWAIDAIERFIRSLGLDHGLMDYKAREEDFEDIAREVRTVFGGRVDADRMPTDAAGPVRILEQSVER